jgi:hypothetical protein
MVRLYRQYQELKVAPILILACLNLLGKQLYFTNGFLTTMHPQSK